VQVQIERNEKYYMVEVPDGTPKEMWQYGVVLGPPDFENSLPVSLAVRLHNELCIRGILTYDQASRRINDVSAAWQSALRYDVGQIIDAYATHEKGV
jgi:hypothetical protein